MNGQLHYEAQARAAMPDASVWVAASAGAGKTKVLVDRVLRLMLSGTAVERILCLTFTRAAAAEMANRISGVLGEWAAMPEGGLAARIATLTGAPPDGETVDKARRMFAEVLDAPGGMRIMTIHSFCESLLGRFPLEAGVAPHFTVMDERTAAETMHAARESLLIDAQRDGGGALAAAVADVTGRINEQEFVDLMTELARERGRLRRMIGADGDGGRLRRRIFGQLEVPENETDSAILHAACGEATVDAVGLRQAVEALLQGSERDNARGRAIAAWLEADGAGRAIGFDDYMNAMLTAQRQPLKILITKSAADASPRAPEVLAREAARLAGIVERRNALAVAGASAALLGLADGLIARYEAQKTAHAILDYDDLILRVRALVEGAGAASWVLYKLDGGIDHILIDEAQDTSPDQWAIVRALTGEFFSGHGARRRSRSVFAVGDTKQSIYSFQRAAPEEFEGMRGHFAARVTDASERWDDVELDVSFRSTASVLRAVDAVFARDDARDGLGPGEIGHTVHRAGQAGLVELWPAVMPEEREEFEPWTPPTALSSTRATEFRLAAALASRIKGWIESGEMLESRARPVRPGDVTVLVRRRTRFVEDLVSELKEAGIPVAGVDRMVLSDQIAIMDLVALGQFALLPEDDLNLAAVLKGPLIGFDEDGLFDLAYGRGESTLWTALRGRAGRDPGCAEAAGYLSGLLAAADYVPPFEFYSDILGAREGRERIVARLGVQANDPLDEFLAQTLEYERAHAPSLQGFLQWFAGGGTEIKRDLEHTGRNEVRVMTVHGAKGLQAPIVILADTMQTPSHGQRLMWATDSDDPEPALPVWRPRADLREPHTDSLERLAKLRRDQEYRRLLYVAMTRAEDRLYVCGYGTRRKPPEDCWYNMILRGLDGIAEADDFEVASAGGGWRGQRLRLSNPQSVAPDSGDETAPPPEGVTPLPGWAREPAPAEPEPRRPLRPSRPAGSDIAAPGSPVGADRGAAIRRGVLVHRLLELLPDIDPAEQAAAARRFLARPVHRLAPDAQAALAEEVLEVIASPECGALFGPGSRAEIPVVGEIRGTVISGRIDRLVVDGATVRIVDYKSDRLPPESDSEIPPPYLRQLAAYRAVLREIYPDFSISCAVLWSAAPRLMPVADALLDRHAP